VNVGIIDLGINNLSSVQRAFSESIKHGDSLKIIESGRGTFQPDLMVLPGLGKFGTGMAALQERELIGKIHTWNKHGTRIVGICLGMQLLGSMSEESPGVEGLNLIPASVLRLPSDSGEKTPHIGWTETKKLTNVSKFPSLENQGDFYFVHSYHMAISEKENILSESQFGNFTFVSAIQTPTILGMQFHPEKSGAIGRSLISEVLNWARNES